MGRVFFDAELSEAFAKRFAGRIDVMSKEGSFQGEKVQVNHAVLQTLGAPFSSPPPKNDSSGQDVNQPSSVPTIRPVGKRPAARSVPSKPPVVGMHSVRPHGCVSKASSEDQKSKGSKVSITNPEAKSDAVAELRYSSTASRGKQQPRSDTGPALPPPYIVEPEEAESGEPGRGRNNGAVGSSLDRRREQDDNK